MNESYILRVCIGDKVVSTATANSMETINNLVTDTDKAMSRQGYRKVRYFKTRIDKKHITTITLDYIKV